VLAQGFDVGNEVLRGVHRQVGAVGHVRGAQSAAALVEQHDPIGGGVEHPAVLRRRGTAGAAVQKDHGLAVGTAADLVVQLLAIPDVEVPGGVRLDGRVEGAHDRHCAKS